MRMYAVTTGTTSLTHAARGPGETTAEGIVACGGWSDDHIDRCCPILTGRRRLRWSVLHDAGGSTAITPPVAVVPGWAARTELGHQWARARRPARPRWWQGSW